MKCSTCGNEADKLTRQDSTGAYQCPACSDKDRPVCAPYSSKGFLAPDSTRSMTCYHAKVYPTGQYMLRIHGGPDAGIMLRGNLEDRSDRADALVMLQTLETACRHLREHINDNYEVPTFP